MHCMYPCSTFPQRHISLNSSNSPIKYFFPQFIALLIKVTLSPPLQPSPQHLSSPLLLDFGFGQLDGSLQNRPIAVRPISLFPSLR